MTKKNNISKCDKCLNGHKILSENGYHTNCSLDEASYIKCMLGTKNSYIEYPERRKEENKNYEI